jgi:hypothetical protein
VEIHGDVTRFHAENERLKAENQRLRERAGRLASALREFVDYYDQAGMPHDLTAEHEADPPGRFDGDEVFNVRMGRKALADLDAAPAGPPTEDRP